MSVNLTSSLVENIRESNSVSISKWDCFVCSQINNLLPCKLMVSVSRLEGPQYMVNHNTVSGKRCVSKCVMIVLEPYVSCDVMELKRFLHYWFFVKETNNLRSLVDSPHSGPVMQSIHFVFVGTVPQSFEQNVTSRPDAMTPVWCHVNVIIQGWF